LKLFITYFITLNLLILTLGLASGIPATGSTSSLGATETVDRRVDRVALQSQKKAISKLKSLLAKHRGTVQETVFLMRLSQLQQQAASLEFRIAYGDASRPQSTPHLAAYQTSVKETLETYSLLVTRFPQLENLDEVLFNRAGNYETLENTNAAKQDYLRILRQYPKSDWALRSQMALAEFAMRENQHSEAIAYLDQVILHPTDSHYSFALYKLAWSHFNLQHTARGMSYLKEYVGFLAGRLSESDVAMREHGLLDVVTFYLDGYEKKLPGFEASEALSTFKTYEPGPDLGKMMLRFAKLLRSHRHDEALESWKDRAIEQEPLLPETIEVIGIVFEHFFNERKFEKMLAVAHDLKKLDEKTKHQIRQTDAYPAVEKLLINVAERLQAMTIKNRNATEVVRLSHALVGVYQVFEEIAEEADPRTARIHYNLGEVYFDIKEYDLSAENYAWIIRSPKQKDLTAPKYTELDRRQVFLRLIGSRYQALKATALIPKEVKLAPLSSESQLNLSALKPELAEWLNWIERYKQDFGDRDTDLESFTFEANRTLYMQGQTTTALQRLSDFFLAHPDSSFAIPSGSLVLDTYISNQAWPELLSSVQSFYRLYKKQKKQNQQFSQRLANTEADAAYKIAELAFQQKSFETAQEKIKKFIEDYSTSPRASEAYYLASQIALALQQKEIAAHYLADMIRQFPKSANRSQALFAEASLAEERYDFTAAIRDYTEYLALEAKRKPPALPKKIQQDILRRIYLMEWLAIETYPTRCQEDEPAESQSEADPAVDCWRYQLLSQLRQPSQKRMQRPPSRHTQPELRTLEAAIALQNLADTTFAERNSLVGILSTGWNHLDALSQFALIPALNRQIAPNIHRNRVALLTLWPLKSNSKSLNRRIEHMQELEKLAAKAVKLPWMQIKIDVLRELAGMYSDFSDELNRVPLPKELPESEQAAYLKSVQEIVQPFLEKSEKLRTQAQEVVSAAPKLNAGDAVIDLPLFRELDDRAPADPLPVLIKQLWTQAVQNKNWGQISFFIQELKDKSHPSNRTLKLMRAVALATVGAQSEALSEFKSFREEAP
jgi:TolA-binding protein